MANEAETAPFQSIYPTQPNVKYKKIYISQFLVIIKQDSVFHCETQQTLTPISSKDPASLTKTNLTIQNPPEFTSLPESLIKQRLPSNYIS